MRCEKAKFVDSMQIQVGRVVILEAGVERDREKGEGKRKKYINQDVPQQNL